MSQISIPDVDKANLEAEVNPLVARARALVVKTREDDEQCQRDLVTAARLLKFVQSVYDGPKRVLNQAHQACCDDERNWTLPLNEVKKILFTKHHDYEVEQKRLADERAAELAAMAKEQEEERLLTDAIAAEDAGDRAAADAILANPVGEVEVSVAPDLARVAGVGKARTIWSAEVVDLKALIKWVAARVDQDPGVMVYLAACMPSLNAMAKAQHGMLKIDGVRPVERAASNVRVK